MYEKVVFPQHPIAPLSSECKNLIKKLLVKDERHRLGSRAGAADVKAHPFFKPIHWALLRNTTPPIIPNLKDPLDGSCFRRLRESHEFDISSQETMQDYLDESNPFKDFESVTIHRLMR